MAWVSTKAGRLRAPDRTGSASANIDYRDVRIRRGNADVIGCSQLTVQGLMVVRRYRYEENAICGRNIVARLGLLGLCTVQLD